MMSGRGGWKRWLEEVVDDTADNVVTIDVETFLLEVLMTREVQAGQGAEGAAGVGQRRKGGGDGGRRAWREQGSFRESS